MRVAGILLMIAGILMLLAFLFQLPAIYELFMAGTQKAILSKILYNLLLVAAGISLLFIGRKIRRSTV